MNLKPHVLLPIIAVVLLGAALVGSLWPAAEAPPLPDEEPSLPTSPLQVEQPRTRPSAPPPRRMQAEAPPTTGKFILPSHNNEQPLEPEPEPEPAQDVSQGEFMGYPTRRVGPPPETPEDRVEPPHELIQQQLERLEKRIAEAESQGDAKQVEFLRKLRERHQEKLGRLQ